MRVEYYGKSYDYLTSKRLPIASIRIRVMYINRVRESNEIRGRANKKKAGVYPRTSPPRADGAGLHFLTK